MMVMERQVDEREQVSEENIGVKSWATQAPREIIVYEKCRKARNEELVDGGQYKDT